ncbi:HAD-IA family hydrolase [Kitasatospora sp. NPDC036755]|uniref:HAD-IA family hydrolase n=1 Tax=Kitasatospora sp. NPDC036755 TaxID=3154600 RepID=UPI0033D025C3
MSTIACERVLFDLDGVLVDSLPLIERILRAWAVGHGLDDDEAVARSYGRRDIDLIALVAPHLDAAHEARVIAGLEEHDFEGIRAVPGAPALLASLPPGRWGIVTSGTRAVARGRLAAAGLPEPDVLLAAEDFERGKPDPEGYLKGAAALGAPAAACVVFEDARAGVEAALAAGMRCVGLGDGLSDLPPGVLAASVTDLTEVRAEVSEQGVLLHALGAGPAPDRRPR